jgi:hypothetical protein
VKVASAYSTWRHLLVRRADAIGPAFDEDIGLLAKIFANEHSTRDEQQ